MTKRYIERILTARVYDVAIESPLEQAKTLSKRIKNNVLMKREDLQPVFSFKLRGAYNKIDQLLRKGKLEGVIAASAGNHAQGLALAAQQRGVKATIVMPKTTPQIKVSAVKSYGAKAVLVGDAYDDAYDYAIKEAEEKQLVFVHPYDDPDVIAGQGTVAMEILRQHPDDIDVIFIPVGGGGLAAGMSVFIKYLRPDIKIVAVEAEESACLAAAMEKNRRVILPQVGIFADGVAVKQIGKETFRLLKQCVDEVITVNTDEMCAAIKDIFDDTRSIMEPAGALAIAGLKKYAEKNALKNKTLVAVNSGANMNFDRLRHVAERSELGENREALLAVTIPEEPGSFHKFCKTLGKRGITEFNYRYSSNAAAHVYAGIQLSDGVAEKELVLDVLKTTGYPVIDLSENEVAKLHVRYMVGGRVKDLADEVVFRFQFPERPGALLQFLTNIGKRWNISMFHYRNHGAGYGRVLVGMQVPKTERKLLAEFLEKTGYPYWDETDNPVYDLFLKG
ncbi:MAG: threonine ammonia-lyase, biosynthetic [Gammaproteobacteria bacterium]|nr:threonine ammonia-lyase, biosynthetic [Gammaproteobacteria bacterium]